MGIDKQAIIELTADIVSAHVSNNSLAAADLPALISTTYAALSGLGEEPAVTEAQRQPAVSIRSSVKPDAITCLECGFKGKMLKRHLTSDHHLTPAEYKARWSLPADYPLVAPAYAETRRELAKKIGLGRKPKQKRPRASKA